MNDWQEKLREVFFDEDDDGVLHPKPAAHAFITLFAEFVKYDIPLGGIKFFLGPAKTIPDAVYGTLFGVPIYYEETP